jgi:hypothetical protein
MTPKERLAKVVTDLQNMVDVSKSPGNFNANPYLHGYANGLILALHTASGADGECPFMPAPAKWLDDSYNVAALVEPVDTSEFDEEFLVGLWVADQRASGLKQIDLDKVETIREGIRYGLEMRNPAN